MRKFTLLLVAIFTASQLTHFTITKAATPSIYENKTTDIFSQKGSTKVANHTNEVIIKYKDKSTALSSYEDLNIEKIKVDSDSDLQNIMTKYQRKTEVELVQPNYIYRASSVNDSYRNYQWGLNLIEAESAWNLNTSIGRGVKVAILDTGIDLDHEDLAANIIGGYDAIDGDSYNDDNGHGTIVAGIVGAIPNNSKGIAGVAGNVSLLAVKVLDSSGYGTSDSISRGILWAADNGAEILNLSLGTDQNDPLIKQAVDYAYNKGCVLVAAAGNEYSNVVSYPAAYDNVIAVSALNEANGIADFSNYGPEIDVTAPGVNIISTAPNHSTSSGAINYGYASGTSAAAPFVSGIAALIKSQIPGITPAEIKQKIVSSTYDLGPAATYISLFTAKGELNSIVPCVPAGIISLYQSESFWGYIVPLMEEVEL